MQFEPGQKNDIPIILKFIKKLAEQGKLDHKLVATEEVLENFLFGSKVYAEVVLGCLDQAPVSYALFSHHFSTLYGRPTLYLVDLFVMPEVRQQGIATKMLSYLAKLAEERSCCRVEWSVLEWNMPAIKLYEKIGAEELADWKVYRISDDALHCLAEETIKIKSM